MTGADADTVRGYYDAVDDGDIDALLDAFAEDVTYHRPGSDTIEGIDALERFYREERPLSDGTHTLHDVRVDGDTVAVRGRFEGRKEGDPVELGFADFHRFGEGGVVERWTYTDTGRV